MSVKKNLCPICRQRATEWESLTFRFGVMRGYYRHVAVYCASCDAEMIVTRGPRPVRLLDAGNIGMRRFERKFGRIQDE